jgi:F-box and WD-40 domain protein 1/11
LFDLAGNNHDHDEEEEEEQEMECKENIRPWEPVIRRMEGHTDRYVLFSLPVLRNCTHIHHLFFGSVYCVEFDSQYVVTGSRDRTIKVWSLKTGQMLGTFQDAHRGSVLCLKFEKDWALGGGSGVGVDNVNVNSDSNSNYDAYGDHDDNDSTEPRPPKGLLVSGSSDCSICVWEMELGDVLPNGEREVRARVKATLEGHEGGVLDIRMDEKWIVSWSVINSFSRLILELNETCH